MGLTMEEWRLQGVKLEMVCSLLDMGLTRIICHGEKAICNESFLGSFVPKR